MKMGCEWDNMVIYIYGLYIYIWFLNRENEIIYGIMGIFNGRYPHKEQWVSPFSEKLRNPGVNF